MLQGYQLCATTEGKSPGAINIVTYSVNYLEDFLAFQEASTDVTRVTRQEIRAFVLYLKQKRCFSNHRFNYTQDKGLSGHTINCYLRSIRIFFSWLVSENIIASNPFDRVKIPRPPRKAIPAFSDSQFQGLLNAIDNLPSGLETFVTRVRKVATQPLYVGFGMSTPEQASRVARIADGVIAGSRIIQLMEADESMVDVADFARELRCALDRPNGI